MTRAKSLIKMLLPEWLLRFITGFFYGWTGSYKSWEHARKKCSGYESQAIFDKTRESALKVRQGLAKYERDSVIEKTVSYSFPVLSGLMWIAARNKGKLNVLDFGGALGSSYFQNIRFLKTIESILWCVVEQPHYVIEGNSNFTDNHLRFYSSIEDCLKENTIDIALLSSVIQYLENPYAFLDKLFSRRINYILFDRTPFVSGNDRITIQKVHPKIYKATYPCWFFNKEKFLDFMIQRYNLVIEFDSLDRANIKTEFKGFLFELKP